MLCSVERRIIFIHIPKTAGRSIYDLLKAVKPAADWCDGSRWVNKPLSEVHLTAAEVRQRIPDWSRYLVFGFVRNPWDRMVSAWAYWTKRQVSFETFVARQDADAGYARYNVPQIAFMTDAAGNNLFSKVGRFETLESDLVSIVGSFSCSLVHANSSTHAPYREHYTPSLKLAVRERFAADIERFGYEF